MNIYKEVMNFKIENGYQILLIHKYGTWIVTYGQERHTFVDIDSALRCLKSCVHHALECAGYIDEENEE